MQDHYWEEAFGYEVKVSKGFTELKEPTLHRQADEPSADFRRRLADKSNMAKIPVRWLQAVSLSGQKFQSDAERKLAVILDRESPKVVQAGQGAVPDLLQVRCRSSWSISPISWRRQQTAFTCWSPKHETKWTT